MVKYYYFFVISIILCSTPYLSRNQTLAQPIVLASPTCGPLGFTTNINANAFVPDSNVVWKIVDSNQVVRLYGSFATSASGSFTEPIFFLLYLKDTIRFISGATMIMTALLILLLRLLWKSIFRALALHFNLLNQYLHHPALVKGLIG
jgi:hypothetical protein